MKKFRILKVINLNGLYTDVILAEVNTKYEAEMLVNELRKTSGSQIYSYETIK